MTFSFDLLTLFPENYPGRQIFELVLRRGISSKTCFNLHSFKHEIFLNKQILPCFK